jgi:hypothetical protein
MTTENECELLEPSGHRRISAEIHRLKHDIEDVRRIAQHAETEIRRASRDVRE